MKLAFIYWNFFAYHHPRHTYLLLSTPPHSYRLGQASAVDMREAARVVRGRAGAVIGSATPTGSSSSGSGARLSDSSVQGRGDVTSSSSSGGGKMDGDAGGRGRADMTSSSALSLITPAHGLPMSSFAKDHAAIVRRVALFQQQQHDTLKRVDSAEQVIRPAKEFLAEINDAVAARALTEEDNLSRKDLEGYGDVIQMLSEIVGECKHMPATPGSFSSICFEKAQPAQSTGEQGIAKDERDSILVHARAMRRVRLLITMGSKQHLENQMRVLWAEFVDGAVQRGRMALHPLVLGEGESSRQKVRAYVRIRDQMSMSNAAVSPGFRAFQIRSPRDSGATPVWSYVYHCLRVGDLDGAVAELKICRNAGLQVESAIIVALDIFQKILLSLEENAPLDGNSFASSAEQPSPLTTLEANDLKEALNCCQQLYFAEDQQQDPDKKCMYRLFVLNLISLSDIDLFSTVPDEDAVPEIEHYLWGSMWYIQWNGILKICGFDSLPDDIPDNGELELYENILGFGGEAYFETPSDNINNDANFEPFSPFTYAKVLICCQRFGDAVNYLWRKDKIFPAIHLAVVCLHYGLILPQRPLTENPKYYGPNASVSATSYGNPEPASIIRVYTSAPFVLDYAEETVDYMMCLSSQWKEGVRSIRERINPDELYWETESIAADNRISQECTHLFTSLDKVQLVKVCGEVRTTVVKDVPGSGDSSDTENVMVRTRGYIDAHLRNPDAVDELLSKAAHYLLNTARDAEGAIHLYQLAGRYADVIQEIVNQLGIVLVPPHKDRAFWKSAATSFYDTFIRKGLSPVVLILQKSEQIHLAKTLGDILNLCSFIDLFTEGQFQEALMVLDSIELLPQKKEDVSRFASRLPSLHPALRKVTNDILMNAMECTRRLYAQRKNDRISEYQGQTNTDVTMLYLRNRAQAIVSFSISTSSYLRQDTPQRLSQIESTMF